MRGFSQGWKKAIDDLDSEVMRSFANFKNGTAVVQHALSQLLAYYERFATLLKNEPYRRADGYPELVDRHQLLNTAKKMHKAMIF